MESRQPVALRRGLRRAYVVVSALWVAYVLFVVPTLLRADALAVQRQASESAKEHLQERRSNQPTRGQGVNWARANDAVRRDMTRLELVDIQLKATETYASWWYRLFIDPPVWNSLPLLVGPPVALYAAGYLLARIAGGLRARTP